MPRMIYVFIEQLDQMLIRALEGWACQGSTKTHNCLAATGTPQPRLRRGERQDDSSGVKVPTQGQ